jgi:hypothetical protein
MSSLELQLEVSEGCVLDLNSIMELGILNSDSLSKGNDANFPTITQELHPVTDIPFFYIHPCNISQVMLELHDAREAGVAASQAEGEPSLDWLEIWFAIVSSVVHFS